MRALYDRELQRRVDEVLYYVWDPIGVSDEPNARGEYGSYVPQILKLVIENDTVEPISSYLANFVTSSMGISADKKSCDHIAQLLLRHKEAIKKGRA